MTYRRDWRDWVILVALIPVIAVLVVVNLCLFVLCEWILPAVDNRRRL